MLTSYLLIGALATVGASEKVVFFGDSITEAGRFVTHVQLFSALRHPGEGIECYNIGKGGDSAAGGLTRWAWDAAPIKPDCVVVMFGMNDSERDTLPTSAPTNAADAVRREGIVSKYRANMAALLDLIAKDCPRITVMTPTPYDQYGTQTCKAFMGGNEPMLTEFARIVRVLAAERGLTLVDLHRPMTQLLKDHPDARIVGGDRIHPSDLGQFLMACHYLKATGENPLVGETRIDAAGRESVVFKYAPSALPLPVTDVYLRAEKFWPVTDCLNREMLVVENLPRGTYALRVDGRELGRFTEVQLRAGVNLALLDTPNRRVADRAEKTRARLCEIESGFRSINYLVKWMKDLNISFDNREACQAFFNERREQAKKLAWGGWHRRCVDKLEAMIPKWEALKAEEQDLRAALRAIRPQKAAFSLEPVTSE